MEEALLALQDSTLVVVETSYAECLNALWKKRVLTKELTAAQMREASIIISEYFERLKVTPTAALSGDALDIGVRYRLPIYDSLYIADAKRRGGVLLTADREMHDVASRLVESRLIGVG